MEYQFINTDRLKYLYDNKLIPNGLMAYNHCWSNKDVLTIYAYACYSKDDNNKIYGLCVGTVYKPDTINRCSQWTFGENRKRELWIEHIHSDSNSPCSGKKLLSAVEKKLEQHQKNILRKNIYVVSIYDAVGFYEKCGYTEIYTPDHENEDTDYPTSFVYGACIGTWMAKPLTDVIDNENIIEDRYRITNMEKEQNEQE